MRMGTALIFSVLQDWGPVLKRNPECYVWFEPDGIVINSAGWIAGLVTASAKIKEKDMWQVTIFFPIDEATNGI